MAEKRSEETLENKRPGGGDKPAPAQAADSWASLLRLLTVYVYMSLGVCAGFVVLAWARSAWLLLGPAAVELALSLAWWGLYLLLRTGSAKRSRSQYPQRHGLSFDHLLVFAWAPVVVLLPLAALFVSDALRFYIPAVTIMIMIVAVRFLSLQRIIRGLAASALAVALLLALNRMATWPRAVLVVMEPIRATVLFVIAGGVVYVVWLLVRSVHVRTIRMRLLVSFSLVGVIPVILFGAGGAMLGWQRGQDGSIRELGLSSAFAAAELESWTEELNQDLDRAMTENEAISYIQLILQPRSTQEDSSTLLTLRETVQRLLDQYVQRTESIDALFVMDATGRVRLTTDTVFAGQEFVGRAFFQQGQQGFYLDLTSRLETGESLVVAAVPLQDLSGQLVGVLAGRASSQVLVETLADLSGMQEQVEAYLVDPSLTPITELDFGGRDVIVRTEGSQAALEDKESGVGVYTNYVGTRVIGAYRWIPELGAALLVEQPQAVLVRDLIPMFVAIGTVVVLVAGIAVAVALAISRSIAAPIVGLAGAVEEIAAKAEASALGSVEPITEVGTTQELNTLAGAFNSMTGQLRVVIGDLEGRVQERTRDLERRSFYLEGAAEIGRTVSSILDVERLFRIVTNMIRERFALGYVALYELEENGEWVVIRHGSALASGPEGPGVSPGRGQGRGGRNEWDERQAPGSVRPAGLVDRVRLGDGLVGGAILNNQVELGAGSGEHALSEAALPLRSRGRVLGALLVSSEQVEVFEQAFLIALQTMADQVAVALDNAHLFRDSQTALNAARRASGELSREAWSEVLRARTDLGFRCDERGVEQARTLWRPEMEAAMQSGAVAQAPRAGPGSAQAEPLAVEEGVSLAVPIRIHEQVIGVLDTFKPASAGGWTRDQVALVEKVAEQLSLALENARLYEETQRRSIREQQLREIGTRMSSTVDLDAILRIAVEDLAQALQVPSAFVQLYEGRVQAEE